MSKITAQSDLAEIAALVSDALERAGISAVLSGGAAVSIYSSAAYLSLDLDFITSAPARGLRSDARGRIQDFGLRCRSRSMA